MVMREGTGLSQELPLLEQQSTCNILFFPSHIADTDGGGRRVMPHRAACRIHCLHRAKVSAGEKVMRSG